jgi:hypothetical protein
VWRVATTPGTKNKKEEIQAKCAALVPNLNVNDLYLSYDILCGWENYNLGVGYETLFASSLAVKYYLRTMSTGRTEYFSFPMIYDFDSSKQPAYKIMEEYKVDFSEGISLPTNEVFTDDSDLGFAIVHNKSIHNAHHDMILPALYGSALVNIAVQAKASFQLSDQNTIMRQLQVRPDTEEQVKQLIWLYLGKETREAKLNSIVFLNGGGRCNGLTLDFFILVKKLRSKNQK